MSDYIEGDGSPENPLRPAARARGALKALISVPRAPLTAIYPYLVQEEARYPKGLTKDMLVGEGVLGRLLRYRVSLSPKRHVEKIGEPPNEEFKEVAGMCFIEVEAVGKAHPHRQSFFDLLDTIAGIIEWDEIGGKGTDYLIRVAYKADSPKTDEIIRKLEQHPLVEGARTMAIRRSKILDNFQPDDFLCFADD